MLCFMQRHGQHTMGIITQPPEFSKKISSVQGKAYYFAIGFYQRINNFQIKSDLSYHRNAQCFQMQKSEAYFYYSYETVTRRKPFMNCKREVESFQRCIQPILVLLYYLRCFQAFFFSGFIFQAVFLTIYFMLH